MATIKLKFRLQLDIAREGTLYFQLIHNRVVRQLNTGFRIFVYEWDAVCDDIVNCEIVPTVRREVLKKVHDKIAWERRRLEHIVQTFDKKGLPYTSDEIVEAYKAASTDINTVFEYMKQQSERQSQLGRCRTSETYTQALHSFMRYRNGVDLYFDMLDGDMVERYESYMRSLGLSRNTSSFYLRILRCIYNRAVNEGLVRQSNPFKNVYTGVDKTAKRAISLKDIRRIKELDLSNRPDIDYARDIFMFSFYMRGMSFIDIAYLRKQDLSRGYITYTRKKTGQQLMVRWEKEMQDIVDKYRDDSTPYLLPIITRQDGTERQQYLSRILFVNRKLKHIARLAKIAIPLSMYVSRHSWASIALSKNVPLSVISEGLGHDNEETTRIYLATIQTNRIDEANCRILKDLCW